jgi:hypothetical protein
MAAPACDGFATLTPELNSIQYSVGAGWINVVRGNLPMAQSTSPDSAQVLPWLRGRSFEDWRDEFDSRGFVVFERVLPAEKVAAIRNALAPHLGRDLKGRNDFEGLNTNRVYALLAKSPVFAELVIHPLVLAFVEAELGASCLLSAFLAINLHPGETVQPWHTDDGGARLPRPRPALGVSTFWAIDDTTETNGSTEVIPGSHLWDERRIRGRSNARRLQRQIDAGSGPRSRPSRRRRQTCDALRLARDRQGHALASRRQQPFRQAAPDHHAAILRRVGATAREHVSRRSA